MFYKEMFFQIEAEVIKNSKCDDYVNGLVTEDEVQYQLSFQGGVGDACISRLAAANLISNSSSLLLFHVWRTRKLQDVSSVSA